MDLKKAIEQLKLIQSNLIRPAPGPRAEETIKFVSNSLKAIDIILQEMEEYHAEKTQERSTT